MPLLKRWAEQQRSHAGVIFVDEKTISPADFGGLIRALAAVLEVAGDQDWRDRVVHLKS